MAKIDWEKHIEGWRSSGLSQALYCCVSADVKMTHPAEIKLTHLG